MKRLIRMTFVVFCLASSYAWGGDLVWQTSKEDAIYIAKLEGKKILLLAGRDTCSNCQYMKETVFEKISPPIKTLIENYFVLWFSDLDKSTEWYPYSDGLESWTLPLICFIDPDDSGNYLDRSTNIQYSDEFYTRIQKIISDTPVNTCNNFTEPSDEEKYLLNLINTYREYNGLSPIRLSKSLTHVAKTHVKDLDKYPPAGYCNGHSWSEYGSWSSCCYTDNNAEAACMWDKPSELTPYTGYGYEIGTNPGYQYLMTAQVAFNMWKVSDAHNDVILNQDIWYDLYWESIGIGIYENYAVVWFGEEEDPCGYWDITESEEDCAGVAGGTAYIDACEDCVGGTTGEYPCAEWVKISGTVLNNEGSPLCAMVLANGQYMFSCGGYGDYELEVPLDDEGKITLFSFCDGLAPFKTVLKATDAPYFDINMRTAPSESNYLSLSIKLKSVAPNGWVTLNGTVQNKAGTPLCAMVLANGQYMFSCNGNGDYELNVPLDDNGEVTIFGFCDGFQPYKETLSGF